MLLVTSPLHGLSTVITVAILCQIAKCKIVLTPHTLVHPYSNSPCYQGVLPPAVTDRFSNLDIFGQRNVGSHLMLSHWKDKITYCS